MSCVYTLASSQAPEVVRYVGVTSKTAEYRLRGHLNTARAGRKLALYDWMRRELSKGYEILVITATRHAAFADALVAEQALIAEHRNAGTRLLNLTDGGEGVLGHKHSATARVKMSAAHAGKIRGPHSEETRQRISEARKGHATHTKPHTEETRRKMSEARRGKKGTPHTEETRRKMSEAQRGVPKPHAPGWQPPKVSEETRRKMSESAKRRVQSSSRNASGKFGS